MSFVNLVLRKYYTAHGKSASGVEIKVNREVPIEEMTVVSLKCMLLEDAGYPGEISEKCPKIQELDISETNIQNWKEVVSLASQLPVRITKALTFLDLTRLRFYSETITEMGEFRSVKNLVLGRCNIPAEKLKIVSKTFPDLVSLEFRGSLLNIPETFTDGSFSTISKLNLAYCKINNFSDLEILSTYPNLSEIKLCNNPLTSINYPGGFLYLKKLNLEGTSIADLVTIYLLNQFPTLTELRLGNTPLSSRTKSHLRKLLISYLPKATKINGGLVSEKEKTSHERQFVRDFSDPNISTSHSSDLEYLRKLIGFNLLEEELTPNIEVFNRLISLHGIVHKFAEISLAPPTKANLIFEVEDGRKELKTVPLNMTVGNLKKLCEKLFEIPIKSQKLLYLDSEVPMMGLELLRFDNKLLRNYRMKDDDVIKIEIWN